MNPAGDPLQDPVAMRVLALLEESAGEERNDRQRDQERCADCHEHRRRQHADELAGVA